MRTRSRVVQCWLASTSAALLLAGCGHSTAQSGTPVAASGASAAASSPASNPAGMSPAGTPSASSPASRSHQASITVIAPPTPTAASTPASQTPASASFHPAVTTGRSATPTSPTTRTATSDTGPSTRSSTPPPTTAEQPPASTQPSTGRHHGGTGALAGKVVVIDPGHNGQNAAHPEIIRKQVPAGFGQYKDCNTTGTETNGGYPEFRFNWKVGIALRDALQAKGITVVMTRSSDDGVGPCVNERAAIGNEAKADAVISIHGDGEAAGVKGFYVMTASRAPAGAAMAAQSTALAKDVRNGLSGAGFPESNTLGSGGLWQRSDLAGLNLSHRPTVMIECGNMRNATEAALMSSVTGQQRYADGIADGVVAYLGG